MWRPGERRYNLFQWAAFLLGFGALELNVVYPAIAAAYTLLCMPQGPRDKYFRATLPMFAVSVAYAAGAPRRGAGRRRSGDYAMHFTGAMFRTLGTYWTWSVGPTFLFTPFDLPKWLLPAGIAVVSAGLLGFLAWKLRAGARVAAVLPGVVSGRARAGAAAARSPDRVLRLPARDRPVLAGRMGRGFRLARRNARARQPSWRSPPSTP